MNFPFYIARRYLFARKSHHVINIISGISVCGVALATMALICTLSVFNGFRDMVSTFFTAFDPELKIVPVEGRYMQHEDVHLLALREHPDIAVITEVLEEQALLTQDEHQVVATLKGVEDNFIDLADLGNTLYGDGVYQLHVGELPMTILGIQLSQQLGVGARFEQPLQVYAPKRHGQVNMANPAASFRQADLYSPGVVFCVMQGKYDNHYALTSLDFTRHLFDAEGLMTALELRCRDGKSPVALKKELQQQLGASYRVMDRYEQQADVFRIMEVEKLLSYIFLSFILAVACFNVVGSLSMLIIDKKQDVQTLRNLGASARQIRAVFMWEGLMIALSGALAGVLLGLLLCWGQHTFGWLTLGDASGSFVVDSYPVSVQWRDVLIVLFTVVAIGWLAVWYPVRYLSRKYLFVK